MKAAVLIEPTKVQIRELPAPVPGKNEVLIKIREAGICGTDYALFLGHLSVRYPIIPGHEAVGEITALGPDVKKLRIGQRVTIQPNFSCGTCPSCLNRKENICPNKLRLGLDIAGVFAQYVNVPEQYVWPLPEDLTDSMGILIEPLSVALHAFDKSPLSPGEEVLVYGAGVIGLLVVQLAVLSGGRVAAFDVAEPRLRIAGEMHAEKMFSSLTELEKGAGSFSIVYETSGTAEALSQIVRLCAPGGRAVLTGLPERDFPVLTAPIVRKELTIQGSMIYRNEFPAAIRLLQRGQIRTDLLLSEACSLENLPQALEDFRSLHRVKTRIRIP